MKKLFAFLALLVAWLAAPPLANAWSISNINYLKGWRVATTANPTVNTDWRTAISPHYNSDGHKKFKFVSTENGDVYASIVDEWNQYIGNYQADTSPNGSTVYFKNAKKDGHDAWSELKFVNLQKGHLYEVDVWINPSNSDELCLTLNEVQQEVYVYGSFNGNWSGTPIAASDSDNDGIFTYTHVATSTSPIWFRVSTNGTGDDYSWMPYNQHDVLTSSKYDMRKYYYDNGDFSWEINPQANGSTIVIKVDPVNLQVWVEETPPATATTVTALYLQKGGVEGDDIKATNSTTLSGLNGDETYLVKITTETGGASTTKTYTMAPDGTLSEGTTPFGIDSKYAKAKFTVTLNADKVPTRLDLSETLEVPEHVYLLGGSSWDNSLGEMTRQGATFVLNDVALSKDQYFAPFKTSTQNFGDGYVYRPDNNDNSYTINSDGSFAYKLSGANGAWQAGKNGKYNFTLNLEDGKLYFNVEETHSYNYKVKYGINNNDGWTAIEMKETSEGSGVWETALLTLFDGSVKNFGVKLYDGDAEVNTGENWWSGSAAYTVDNSNYTTDLTLVSGGSVNPTWALDGQFKLSFNANTGALTVTGTPNTISKVELFDGNNKLGDLYNTTDGLLTQTIAATKDGKALKVKLTRSDNEVRWFSHSGDINFNGEYDATQGEAVTTFKSLYSGKVGVTVDPTHLTVTKINLTDADKVIYLYKNDGSWNTNVGALTAEGNNYVIDADLPDGKYFALSTNPAANNYTDLATADGYVRYAPTADDVTITSADGYTATSDFTGGKAWQASAPYDRYKVSIAKDRSSMSILPYVHTLTLYKDGVAVTADTDVTGVTSATKFKVEDVVSLGGTTTATNHYTHTAAINADGDIALTETDNASAAFSFDKDIYQFHFGGITRTTDGVTLAVSNFKREGFYPVEAGSASNENALVEEGTNGDIKQYRLLNKYDNRGTDQTRYFKPVVPAGSASAPRRVAGTTVPAGVYTEFTTVTSADEALLDINKNFVVTAEWNANGTPSRLSVVDPTAQPDLYFFGASHGWSSSDPLKFKYNPSTNTYTLSVWVNNQGERGFKVATKKGTWDEVNSETYSYNNNKDNTGGVGLNTDIDLSFYTAATDAQNMWLQGDDVEYGNSSNDRLFTITISDLNPGVGAKMVVKEEQKMFIYGSFNHTGDSNTGTAWSWDRHKMDYDSTTGLYTYTYTALSATNPFLFRLWNGSRDFAAIDRDRQPLYNSYVETGDNNSNSFEVPSPGVGQKIVITFDRATNKVKSNVTSNLPDDVAYRALPVMPYVVRKSNAADQWSAWTNDQPVVYVLGHYVNNNRIVPDWELLPQGDGTYKLDNVTLRGVDATNIKALVIYKDKATAQEYTISFPETSGLETENDLNYGRSYNLVYDNSTHKFTATPTANSNELPFISLIGHSYRQQSDEMTPGGVTTTEGGWTEGWVLYGENKQPLRDLQGNYIYSTQWPPRNTIYFKAVRQDPTLGTISFDWPSDKLIFKPQRSDNALTVMAGKAWETAMNGRDDEAYANLDLVDDQKYARYVINDTWMLGATKIWTGWASAFFELNYAPYPEWIKHMNWGVAESSSDEADSGREIEAYTTIEMVNGQTEGQGNFFMQKPTYFKTVEFYLPVLENGTPDREHVDNARFYTTLALAEAKIEAKSDKIGSGDDNNTGAFRVRYDEAKTSLTLQSWKVSRYSADLTKDMDNSENWVEAIANDDENAVLVYKSIKEEDEALGATVVATQDDLKTGLDATNSSTSDYTKESVTLPNGRYFYGLEITFTDGTNSYKETIPSTIFTLTTLDAEPACTPLQLVLIKDEDNVKANSIVKPYAGKYLTYRPKRNGTYYIVDEADNTAEPLDAVEADKVIKALVADPMLFTWTADYYVFAFDYSDYEESMTQAQKAGTIVKFNKNPQVEIYNLPVVYDTHGNMVTNPNDIATLNTNADNAAEGWITCKKTNSTGYYGFLVKSHGKLEPMYYRGRVKYDYTVNEGEAPTQKVAAVNGSLRPTMPQPFGLKFEYQTPESSEVASGINSEVTVHTTSSILPKLDGNGNLDIEDGIVKRREVDVKFPWNGEGTSYFSPRDFNCVIEFIQPNVCYEIMENYHIRYDVVISNDYTMSNPDFYNPQTGVWTAPTQDQLNADKKLLYQRAYYYDEEIDDTGDAPYRFVINNVSPTDQINPVFQIVNVLYTNKTNADLTANYVYTPLKLVCNSTFTKHKAPDYDKIYLQARENQLGGYDWFYYGHVDKTDGSSELGVDDDNSNTNTKMIPSMYHFEAFIKDTNDEGIMKRTDGAQNTNLHLDLDYYYGGFREVMYHNTDDHTCALVENSALPADPLIGKCILANAPKDRALEVRITPIFVFKRHPEGEASDEADVIGLVKEGTSGQQSAPRYVNAAPAGTPEYVVMRGESFEKNTDDTDMFPGTTGLENLNGYDDAEPEYYNIQGMRITEPKAGEVYIVRRGGKVTKELMR